MDWLDEHIIFICKIKIKLGTEKIFFLPHMILPVNKQITESFQAI